MIHERRQYGLTLSEMLVVMAILAILFGVGLQTAKMIHASFESGANVRQVISAALANARALAMQEGTYAGVRFQADRTGRQYLILIRHDDAMTGLANGFVAVENRRPTPLPKNVWALDTRISARVATDPPSVRADKPIEVPGNPAASDANLDEAFELTDAMTFSVVFNKAGRLVVHDVRVRKRFWREYPEREDDLFNTQEMVDQGRSRFIQDDYAALGLGQEPSRNCFYVVQRRAFEQVDAGRRWSGFLQFEAVRYVNPFSGEIVNQEVRP